MSHLILGIDAGNHKAKVAGEYGVDTYRTAICGWLERNIEEVHGKDDMEFKIDGRKGFAGTIAIYEDEYGGGSMYGESKAHGDTKIRVLLAIYRYLKNYCAGKGIRDISIVTGQPIISHTDTEKSKIIEMLEGPHEYTVNGEEVSIHIQNVAVGAEGSGAYWSNPEMGKVHVIDVGSGTVNCATIFDGKYINRSSDTFNFGMETVNNKEDLEGITGGIVRGTSRLKYDKKNEVLLCGGIAKEIFPYIASHYPKTKLIQPILATREGIKICEPVYANAVGFYMLAKKAFG